MTAIATSNSSGCLTNKFCSAIHVCSQLLGGKTSANITTLEKSSGPGEREKIATAMRAYLENEREILSIISDLHRRFPPNRYYIISLGRSLTVIATGLQTLAMDYANSLPFSVSHRPGNTESLNSLYWTHFEKFVPDEQTLAGRQVVLIDYVPTGQSLIFAEQKLSEYLNARNSHSRVQILGFTIKGNKKVRANLSSDSLYYTSRRLNSAVLEFKVLAEYPKFKVDNPVELQRNIFYDEFQEYLKKRMNRGLLQSFKDFFKI